MTNFTYKPLHESDLPMLFAWFDLPHIATWWKESRDWQTFTKKYRLRIPGTSDISCYIVYHENTPIGYIKWHDITMDPLRTEDYPDHTYGIDIFIANLAYVGKGYGPAIIKQFIYNVMAPLQPKKIVIDPEITNLRAIRAYEKVGFVKTIQSTTINGTHTIQAQIMELDL